MLSDSRRGSPCFRDLIQGKKFGQCLRIQLVGLALAVGNHPQLAWMGQYDCPDPPLDAVVVETVTYDAESAVPTSEQTISVLRLFKEGY